MFGLVWLVWPCQPSGRSGRVAGRALPATVFLDADAVDYRLLLPAALTPGSGWIEKPGNTKDLEENDE